MKKYKQYRHKKLGYIVEQIEHGDTYKGDQYYQDIADKNFVLSEWFLIHSGDWEEIVEKPVLFTTFDGKEIREGDEHWFIPNNLDPMFIWKGVWKEDFHNHYIRECKSFSTQKAAEDYILHKKKLISLDDLVNLNIVYKDSHLYGRIKEIAIKNNEK